MRSDELVLPARATDRSADGHAGDGTVALVANVLVEVVATVVVSTARGARPLVRAVSPIAGPVAGVVLRPPWIDRRFWPETQLRRYAERGRARGMAVQRSAAQLGSAGIPALVNAVLDQIDLTRLVPDADALPPEELFDRAWRDVVLARAVQVVQQALKPQVFDVFRRYDLEGGDVSYETLARDLGLTADTVKNHLTRAREEFRQAVRSVVCATVADPRDLSSELRELFGM